MTDKLATQKVQQLRDKYGDRKTSTILGISRSNLYNKLASGEWSKIEKRSITLLEYESPLDETKTN